MVINHTLPMASMTMLCGPLSAWAATLVEYKSRCQKTSDFVSRPTRSSAMIQHPTSCVRWLTGLHTPPGIATPCARDNSHRNARRRNARMRNRHAYRYMVMNLTSVSKCCGGTPHRMRFPESIQVRTRQLWFVRTTGKVRTTTCTLVNRTVIDKDDFSFIALSELREI